MRVGITGAGGLVGSAIGEGVIAAGGEVIAISSKKSTPQARHFELGQMPSERLFDGLDAVFHCGYDFSAWRKAENDKVNVKGSLGLLRRAEADGLKAFIFVSSMSAFEGTKSVYGLGKLAVEKAVLESPIGIVIRPGLVDDGRSGGIYGKLRSTAAILSVLPNIDGGKPTQYLVTTRFLTSVIAVLMSSLERAKGLKQPVIIAQLGPVHFDEMMIQLWREKRRSEKKPLLVPVPSLLIYLVLKIAEGLRFPLNFRSDSLVGLVYCDRSPNFKPFFQMIEGEHEIQKQIDVKA